MFNVNRLVLGCMDSYDSEKRRILQHFLRAQTKSPVEKRKAKRENNMRKYARIVATASSKLRPVTLLQGAPHSPRGACYAGWKKAARRLYAAMLLHFLLANSTRLH